MVALPARFRVEPAEALILLLALASGLLYCCLLPLWAGFDEPFHYGYVEYLSSQRRFPQVNRTTVSNEIRESLKLTPVSWILHNALPGSIAFEGWFRLTPEQQRGRDSALARLSPALQEQPSDLLNYEAQQAPLAYILLCPLNAVVARMELRSRILALRLAAAVASTVLLFFASRLLLRGLGLDGPFRLAVLACVFESQMLWASIAHVGNDWLAIPLGTLLLALLVMAAREGEPKYVLGLAGTLAAGLLTKAYFLAFVPVLGALVLTRWLRGRLDGRAALLAGCLVLLAAPWYARNLVLYGSFSGTQESIAGVGLSRALGAFFHVNWLTSATDSFRWALWTGNWSFISFSRATLNAEMVLIALAFALFFARMREVKTGEWWALLCCAAFLLSLIYQTCVTWAATNGQSHTPEPWYLQCIVPALWALAFLGLQRNGAPGRIGAVLLLLINAWIAAATYLVKLIPLYGGFTGRGTISAVLHWWQAIPVPALSLTVLGPLWLLFAALTVFLLALGLLTIWLLRGLIAPLARVT